MARRRRDGPAPIAADAPFVAATRATAANASARLASAAVTAEPARRPAHLTAAAWRTDRR